MTEYHAKPTGLKRWLTTTDHKEIGILYIVTAFIGLILGGIMAMLVRLELLTPKTTFIYDETYNQLFTMHALTMIFFFVMPMFAGLGNYFVPLQIGAKDMAFPRINALGYWLIPPAMLFFFAGFIFKALGLFEDTVVTAGGGWTMYVPLNTAAFSPSLGTDFLIFSLHIVGISSILGAINFVVTIFKERAPGMTMHDISLFTWSILTMAILLAFATPSLTVALTMLLLDRRFGTGFFDPTQGGDPVMWQHLFWFFGHPEVYILILPGMGIISEVLPRMARKPIFGYHAIAYSTVAIGIFGFGVWVHHMFTTGESVAFRTVFMALTFAIGVPTGVKIFNWLATLWHGSIQFKAPLLFAVGFLSMFLIGGINGVFVASIPVDYGLHDTYWVVSHLHYVLFGGSVMAITAGIYYWWPRLTGRMYSEKLALWHFILSMVGLNLVFFTMHFLGVAGMPRRVAVYDPAFQTMNVAASIGAFILGFSQLLWFINMAWSLRRGKPSPKDPWKAGDMCLEWKTMPRVNFPRTPMPHEAQPSPADAASVKA